MSADRSQTPQDGTETIDHSHPSEQPGYMAGRYKLIEKIGEGGMGEVWVARQEEPVKRKVALKLIRAGMDSKGVLARFEQERQALAMMDHPHIARVFDGGLTDDRRPFFAMELVNGVPLTRFCDEARLGIRERLALFVPICQAVQHAHQKGIIHRDLKPSNILVALYDGRPVPKVIDFGLVKATGGKLTEASMSTHFAAMVGTLDYMAPEQAGFSAIDVDTRADIYSLGVILYELLTGLKPFDSQRLKQAALNDVVRILREEEPPRPSTRLSSDASSPSLAALRKMEPKKLTSLMRGELDWVVMKCLEKERGRRYETANGLARDVERYLADEAVEARPPSAGYRLQKFARRNKGPVLAASLVFLALLAGIVGTTRGMVLASKRAEGERVARLDEGKQRRQAEANERRAIQAEAVSKKQEAEAKLLLEATVAVTQFLRDDLLGQAGNKAQADRKFEPKYNLTIREALDRAASAVGEKFKYRPDLEALIRRTVGSAYLDVGEFDKAAEQLRQASAGFTAIAGPDHQDTLATLDSLAVAYGQSGQLSEAIALLENVRDTRITKLGPEHQDTLTTLANLAMGYHQAGRLSEAIALFEQVRNTIEKVGWDDADLTPLDNLAGAYVDARRIPEAITLFERVRDTRIKRLGPEHPETLATLNNLGQAYWENKQFEKAVAIFEALLPRMRAQSGDDRADTIMVAFNLGLNYCGAGRMAEAVQVVDEWLPRATKNLSAKDQLRVQNAAAATYDTAKRFDRLVALLEDDLAWLRSRHAADDPHVLEVTASLGQSYWKNRQFDKAVATLEPLLSLWRTKFGDEHPDTFLVAFNLGVNYREAGRLDDSLGIFDEWMPRAWKDLPVDHQWLSFGRQQAAATYEKAKRFDRLVALCEASVVSLRARDAADPQLLAALGFLGQAYWQSRQFDKSVAIYEDILPRRRAKFGDDHPDTFLDAFNLGVNYRDADRLDEAVKVFDEWLPRAAKNLPADNKRRLFGRQEAAATYEKAKRFDRLAALLEADLASQRTQVAKDDPGLSAALASLGLAQLKASQFAEAEPILQECLDIREQTQPDDWRTSNTRSMLGGAFAGQKKYAEAEPLLLAGYEGLQQRESAMPAAVKIRLTEALERLVQLYEAWDKPDEAAKWRKKQSASTGP